MTRLTRSLAHQFLPLALLTSNICQADFVARELGRENDQPEPYVVPYGFVSEEMGLVAGVAGGIGGLPQRQNSLFVTGLVSDEGAAAAYLWFNDYQFSNLPRLFLDAGVGYGEFPQQRAYLDRTDPGRQPPAGSNDSSSANYFDADGLSEWIELDFKYLLEIGHARYFPVNNYTLSEGLLVGGASGGRVFNPFKSGRSYVELTLFHEDRDYEDSPSDLPLKTSGIGIGFEYNNTDFPINPSTGSVVEFEIRHDPGAYEDENWTVAEIELSHHIRLPELDNTEQRVVAVNFWTATTLSDARAPYFAGPTLGGLYRLRAYPIERYHDHSAIYYSAEYRIIPKSDLLRKLTFLKFIDLQWWEIAAFVELGRVAPNWKLDELHESMQWDFGLSLRVMANHDIGRFDIAISEDDTAAWFMYGHPF